MNYRTKVNAETITLAILDDRDDEVLVHTACAEANPDTCSTLNTDYEFEDGQCCAICASDLNYLPDMRWSDAAVQIMQDIEESNPGGLWEAKYICLRSDGNGRVAANVYYFENRAVAVLYPSAATTQDFDS